MSQLLQVEVKIFFKIMFFSIQSFLMKKEDKDKNTHLIVGVFQ